MGKPMSEQGWRDRAAQIVNLIDVTTKDMHNQVEIEVLHLGYTLRIGCIRIAFRELDEMMEWLALYLTKSKVFIDAYQEAITREYPDASPPISGPAMVGIARAPQYNPEPEPNMERS